MLRLLFLLTCALALLASSVASAEIVEHSFYVIFLLSCITTKIFLSTMRESLYIISRFGKLPHAKVALGLLSLIKRYMSGQDI